MNVHEAIVQKLFRIVENDLHQSSVLVHRLNYYSENGFETFWAAKTMSRAPSMRHIICVTSENV